MLVLANKQDVEGAMTEMEISQSLKLHALKQQSWQIQACSAVTGAAAKADKCHRVRMAPHPTLPRSGGTSCWARGVGAQSVAAPVPLCRSSVASTAWRRKAPPPSRPQPLSRLTRPHPHCLRHTGKGLHEGMDWVAHTLRTKR